MTDPARHHRRIRRKAHAVHWGLLPLALLVPGAWIYAALDVCQETIDPFKLALCRYSVAVPLLPAAVGLALAAWILKDLAHLGAHHAGADTPRLHHIHHGYRSLDRGHKRHVHFALGQAVIVALALAAWLLFEIYRSTY